MTVMPAKAAVHKCGQSVCQMGHWTIGLTKLATLSTFHIMTPEFGEKIPEGSTLISEDIRMSLWRSVR